MIENNKINKEIFIAKYWGQKVFKFRDGSMSPQKVGATYMTKYGTRNRYLLLTPLSMITDEHAIEVALLNGSHNFVDGQSPFGSKSSHMRVLVIQGKAIISEMKTFSCVNLFVIDFLRSKGYYVGDGTEINYGWAVLKTDK